MDMRIGKSTYGLFLISDNCHSMFRKCGYLKKLRNKLDVLHGIDYLNSWTLFGIHDTAILVRSDGRLDNAVSAVDNWVDDCNREKKSIEKYLSKQLKYKLLSECRSICDSCECGPDNDFKIFKCWLDPLIPIYINEKLIESDGGVFLIMYVRFYPESVNLMLNGSKSNENSQNIYEYFKDDGTMALFHGFGLFDVIIITKKNNYKEIKETMIETPKKSKIPISNIHSLISIPSSLNNTGYEEENGLNCSMMLKIRMMPDVEESKIWNRIKKLAKTCELEGLCIKESKVTDRHCPLYTSFRPGFFDVAIDFRFKEIENLNDFIMVIEYMTFVEDTATVISYDTDLT